MTIALTGPHGVGKDTVYRLIQQAATNNTLSPHRLAFAGPVKKAAQAAFGLSDEWLDDTHKGLTHPVWCITPRQMYQTTADIYQDKFGADFWVRTADATWQSLHGGDDISRGPVIVITDLTDPIGEIESEWVRSLPNSFVVHLDGPVRGRAAGDGGGHRSTRGVACKDGDFTLSNTGSVDRLALEVGVMLGTMCRKLEAQHA
jgi:hypothetical protein